MSEVQTSGLSELPAEKLLEAAKAEWPVAQHPFLGWFSDEELVAALRAPGGPERVADLYRERTKRLYLESEDGEPLRFGSELPNWKDADAMLRRFKFIYVAGGKRASKSEWAAKRFVASALKFPRGVLWAFQDNLTTSIATQQKLIWKFLPTRIKALNGKQDRRKVYNVNYSIKNGFADGVLVLPNRTAIHFLTYNSEVKDYQGWQIGAPEEPGAADAYQATRRMTDAEKMCYDLVLAEMPVVNLGFWADEDMPLPWMETCEFRATTRNACGIWTFSTTAGITTTIKSVVGTAKTIESRPAELLPDRQNVPGLPVGHMPYRQECARPQWGAIYFFSEFNVFGQNYQNVKALCEGKPSFFIQENAYGHSRDVMNKVFPLFGEWNVIKRSALPRLMTSYMLTDPGDASRNWASIWVGVDPRGAHYIYRDWPDAQTFGEWAVPSPDPRQPDGQRGPAQRSLGFGVAQLAEAWRMIERARELAGRLPANTGGSPVPPKTVSGIVRATPTKPLLTPVEARAPEIIFERYIDPRAASNPHIEEHGGTNLYQKFAELPEPMLFTPWSGVEKAIGYAHVNSLLYWNQEEPLCWPTNAPKLYVCEDCQQVIWMFSNFTGLGGDKAGSKDFADLIRGMALADLQYYETNVMESHGPRRGY